MTKWKRDAKSSQSETGHGNPELPLLVEEPVLLSPGMRTIVDVEVEPFYDKDSGELSDRRVTVRLNCKHVKQFSPRTLAVPVPTVGESSRCLRIACRGADE